MLDTLITDHAPIFTIPALVGTLFFVLRIVLMLVGAAVDHDLADVDPTHADLDAGGGHFDVSAHGHGHDGTLADSTQAFKVVSLQAIAGFVMGFGWGGLGAYRGLDFDLFWSSIAAVGGGIFIVWLLSWLLKSLILLHGSGNIPLSAAVGREGQVYVSIPESGRGQVRLVVRDRARIYNAVSSSGPLPSGTRIRVTATHDDRMLTVTPVYV